MIRTLYSPLTKAEENDDGSVTIEGIASAETVDAMGETILASAMEAALPDFLLYGTGALREMHQLSAAGTIDSAVVNKVGETRVSGTVVDPIAVIKIKAGVYKGLSIGGKVLARDPKDKKIITKIKLTEISLVDRPSCPEAVLEMWKADTAHLGNLVPPAFTPDEYRDALRAMPAAERARVLMKASLAIPRSIDDLGRRQVARR